MHANMHGGNARDFQTRSYKVYVFFPGVTRAVHYLLSRTDIYVVDGVLSLKPLLANGWQLITLLKK